VLLDVFFNHLPAFGIIPGIQILLPMLKLT
jgi:hypothetical protein